MQRGFVPIVVAVFVLIIALLSLWGGMYLLGKANIGKSFEPKSTLFSTPIPSAIFSPTPSASSSASPSPSISPDETANWKVYEDTELGFLIKYPPNNYTISKADSRAFFQSGKTKTIWIINFQPNTKKLELFDWLKNNYYGLGYDVLDDGTIQKPAQADITVSPATVGIYEAFETKLASYNPLYNKSSTIYGQAFVFLTPDKSKIVTINSNIHDVILNKVIKTFKFLSANPTEVSWYEAVNILNSGKVVSILQAHNLDVRLILNDKTAVKTVEPKIDDIFKELSACQVCKDKQISVATE